MKIFDLADPEKILTARFMHVVAAFLISLFLPALFTAIEWNSYEFELYTSGERTFSQYFLMLKSRFLFIYIIGCIMVIIFGIPAFYILRIFFAFKILTVCLVAAFIAILPNLLIEINAHFSNLFDANDTSQATFGKCEAIINGQRTFCGWQHFLYHNIFIVGLHGAIAGMVFWLLMRLNYFYKK